MTKPKLIIPVKLNRLPPTKVLRRLKEDYAMRFSNDYDWDYIYELMLDPRINPFDQIKYSEQISQLRREMEEIYKDRSIPAEEENNNEF